MAQAADTEPVPAPTSQTTLSGRTAMRATANRRMFSLVMGVLPRISWSSHRQGVPACQPVGAGFSASTTARSSNCSFASSSAVPETMRSSG